MTQQFHTRGIKPREIKIHIHKKTYKLYTVALFIVDKNRNNPNVYQWMNGKTNCSILMQWNLLSNKKE